MICPGSAGWRGRMGREKELAEKITDKAHDVYEDGANASYAGTLGQKGRLDLPAFLNEVPD